MKGLSGSDLAAMKISGRVAAQILNDLGRVIRPGISTKDIETFFDNELCRHAGMTAAFKGYSGYPAAVCVSVNDEVIHGIPAVKRVLREGDLVSVDLGIRYKGTYVDTASTYAVGQISDAAKKLCRVTREALDRGIAQARAGAQIGDVAYAIQKVVEDNGFSVVRQFVGHGIGKELHLPPEVPNFGSPRSGYVLEEGAAIAIEPMVSAGGYEVVVQPDGWTAKMKDGSLSAHYEHTVAITKDGPLIITL